MNAEEFYEKLAEQDERVEDSLPQLLKVINGLRKVRKSKVKTIEYIDKFRKKKYKATVDGINKNGEKIQIPVRYPDMAVHDTYVMWLHKYFDDMLKRSDGTITYAYALEYLVDLMNNRPKRLGGYRMISFDAGILLEKIKSGIDETE